MVYTIVPTQVDKNARRINWAVPFLSRAAVNLWWYDYNMYTIQVKPYKHIIYQFSKWLYNIYCILYNIFSNMCNVRVHYAMQIILWYTI